MERGFEFNDGYFDPHCDFCGRRYESLGVQVRFKWGYEICPSCILQGPKVVGTETTKRPPREFHSMIRRWFMSVNPEGSNCGIPSHHACGLCGARYFDYGLPVTLCEGGSDGPWVGNLCGKCLTSDPKRMAELARQRAPILRVKRDSRDDDPGTNSKQADDLHRAAEMLDTLASFDEIPDGVFARKIGEGYLESEAGRPKRSRKAA